MGASNVANQLRCSLWRHYLGHIRQWPWVLGALVVALTPFALLAGLKSTVPPQHLQPCHFEARGLSSEWPLGMVQSMVCGMSNECQDQGHDDLLDYYPGAAVNELINATALLDGTTTTLMDRLIALPHSLNMLQRVADLITTPPLTDLMENGMQVSDVIKSPSALALKLTSEHELDLEVVEAFLDSRINISRVLSLAGVRGPKEVVCSPEYLAEFLVTNNTHLVPDISRAFCHLPLSQAANVTAIFLSSLDPQKLIQKVGEVVEAVGGYNSQVLMQQVGGLLAAVGRLQALGPLGSSLAPILSALRPARSAMEVLSLSMWDEVSLGDFLGFVEGVVQSFTANTSMAVTEALQGATNAAQHLLALTENPANLTHHLQGVREPWGAALTQIGKAVEVLGGHIETVPAYVKQHPILRSLLSLAATALSTLLHSHPYNATRLESELDQVLSTLLEEYQIPLDTPLALALLPTLHSATLYTQAADALASLVVKAPPLPFLPAFTLLTLFSNCSHLKSVVEGAGLDSWLCEGEAWQPLGVEDQNTLSGRFCSESGRAELGNVTQLLQKALNYSQETQDNITVSEVMEAVKRLTETLASSVHLRRAVLLAPMVLTPTVDLEWWRRWQPETMEMLGDTKGSNESESLLPLLPPLGSEGFKDLEEGVKGSKHIIRRLVTVYLGLVGGECGGVPGALTSILSPQDLENTADMATSVLDTLVHLAALTQEPWRPGDLIRHPNVTSFLTSVLPPNVMMMVMRGVEVAQYPWVEAPAPVPQVLALLNATHTALTALLETGDVWSWCGEGGCPHLAHLTSYVHLLPTLVALNYYTTVFYPSKDSMQILNNSSAWRYYPCQNTNTTNTTNTTTATPASLSLLFPPTTSSFTPTSHSTIEKVKQEVKDLEGYVCVHFDGIMDELTSNEELTSAVKAFMDHLTPEKVNLGAAVGLVRSLWRTVTQLDMQEVVTNLTGGSLTLQDWERPYSYLAVNTSDPYGVVMLVVDKSWARVLDAEQNGTHNYLHALKLGLQAAHNITTALTHTLQKGEITLAEIIGSSEDDPVFSAFVRGPQGLADYLLNELNTSVVAAIMHRDLFRWVVGLCNHGNRSLWVAMVCNYTQRGPPIFLSSKVSVAVIEAMTQFRSPVAPQPLPMAPSRLFNDLQDLTEAVRLFDFTKPPNITALDQMVNTTRREVDRLLKGLTAMMEDWPFAVVDAGVQKGPEEVRMVIRQTDATLSLLLRGLPSSSDNTTSPITELFHLLNTTWVDLLAGIHYNIQRGVIVSDLTVDALTLGEVCGPNATLREPEGGDGRFLEAVQKLCVFVASNAEVLKDTYSPDTQNTSTPLPSIKQVLRKTRELVRRVEVLMTAARVRGPQDILGWPSYFVKDNWRTLMARIYPGSNDSSTTEGFEALVPSLMVALRWMGVPQNSSVPQTLMLQIKWMDLMLATDLKATLNNTLMLKDLADALTLTAPLAVRDVVSTLADHPQKVVESLVALQGVGSGVEVCGLNMTALGNHSSALLEELCQLTTQGLVEDLKNLLGLEVLQQPDNNTSLEEALTSFMTYIATLDKDVVGAPLGSPAGLVQYLGLQQWVELPNDAFNVTWEDMEINSTMILATVLGPLVAQGQQATEEGRVVRASLLLLSDYLRMARWLLMVSAGNVREAYMDKPIVIQFLDLLDQLPEVTKEYINLFSQSSTLSQAVQMRLDRPCAFHINLMEALGEGVQEGKEGRQLLNNTIHFLCDNATQTFLWQQFLPDTIPVIMGEFMDLDAATLAHLVTEVGGGVVEAVRGKRTMRTFDPPPWLAVDRWQGVYHQLRNITERPLVTTAVEVVVLGLSAVQTHPGALWGARAVPAAASAMYQVSRRLIDGINETSGRLDLAAAVKGLGSVEELAVFMAPRMPTFVALAMWFPESYANWRLLRGDHWLEIVDEMCDKGFKHLLLHPGLTQQDWEDIRLKFCNLSLPQLREDLTPLFNDPEVIDGEVVDWAVVREAVEKGVARLSVLDPRTLREPFVNNAFTRFGMHIPQPRRLLQGVAGQLIWLQRASMERFPPWFQFREARTMVEVMAAMEPISREVVPGLLERLRDPDLFLQLVKDYQEAVERLPETLASRIQSPLNESSDGYPLYGEVYSDLYTTIYNLTSAVLMLLPRRVEILPYRGEVARGSPMQSFINNVWQNGGEIIKIARNMTCSGELFFGEEGWTFSIRWLKMLERQLGRVEDHIDLACRASTTNLTQLLTSLWEDLGWQDETTEAMDYSELWDFGCLPVMNQIIATYEKLVDVVRRYEGDETAGPRLSRCLADAVSADAGQQLIGIFVASENFIRSALNSPNVTRIISSSVRFLPGDVRRALSMLASRVAVWAPLQEMLVRDYHHSLNMSSRVLSATKHLSVDVNRIYPGSMEKLAVVSRTAEGMQRWLRVLEGEGGDPSLPWDPEEEETPLEVMFQFAQSRGVEVFALDLLNNVNYTHLLTKVREMRLKTVLSLTWLDPIIAHMTRAYQSLTALARSGSISNLNKMITGEEDPLTFLAGSVKIIHMEEWNHLAQSFQGLMEDAVPLLTGSQLEEDLQKVVQGVNSVLEARDMGLMDFNVPITSLVVNWTGLEHYLLTDLSMDPKVVETLAASELNLLALVSVEGTSAEEVLCRGQELGRLVVVPAGTQVTPAQLSAALCSSGDPQALAASFLSQLNLTPLMTLLTRFGVNTSLSSQGVSLGEVAEAVRNVAVASEHMPALVTTLQAFHNLSDVLLAKPRAQRLVANQTAVTIGNITSPEFLERAGQALCGRPLALLPDTLRLNDMKTKPHSTSKDLDVCERLREDLRSLPGGGLLLHHIQPLLTGKIFFTPDNSITRAIMAQANKTFEAVEQQQQNLRSLSQRAKGITAFTSSEFDLRRLEAALEMPWVQGAIKDLLHAMPSSPSLNLTSLPPLASLTANLKASSPHLLESSRLVREFSDVLEVGVSLMSCLHLHRFIPVRNESQLLEEAHQAVVKREFLAGVVFKDVGESGDTETSLPADVTYTIRVDYSKSPPTFLLGPRFWRPGPYSDITFYMRYQQGFIQLQETLENAIVKLQHRQASAGRRRKRSAASPVPLTEAEEDLLLNLPLHTKQQPYPCYTKDDFLQMVNESPVMSFVFSFLALVIFSTFIIQRLVQERESRNKQLQEVMGLHLWLDHLVWLLSSVLLLLIIVVLAALVLSLGGLQPRADLGVLIAFLLCYGLSVVSFCYLVASLVPTTVLAVFTGVMGLLVFNIPFVSISVIQASVPLTVLLLTCLFPSSAFGFGFRVICQYELLEEGASHANMWTPPTKGSEMTLGLAIVMLLVDAALFLLISLAASHLRQVCRAATLIDALPDTKVAPGKDDVSSIKKEALHIVDLDLGLKQSLRKGLSISGLRKIYHQGDGGSRLAVDGVTLDLYEGQVLALLGHNGAGKTTIISMLTREVQPTAGSIQVYGEDISTAEGWDKARQMIGLCPQESVLFPLLTVEETLAYYSTLKQRPEDPPPTKVSTLLVNMNLLEYRYHLSHQLSEGLRRRLCMALAFVGHSRLVVLDEPTSGIDPAARSVMWEVISNNRSGRTILLTTHHLDEAETLADRVAVLHKGRLLCVGSPLALKSEYGLGYSITLSRSSSPSQLSSSEEKLDPVHAFKEKSALSYCDLPFKVMKTSNSGFGSKDGGDKEEVWALLTQYVPNARLLENLNGEMTYSLPIHDALGNTNRLPELFGALQGRLEALGFASLELRPTSLEDVIIALNTINSLDNTASPSSLKVEPPLTPLKEDLATTYDFALVPAECCVGLRRLAALLHKRLLHHGRDWHFYVQMFVLPFVFILLAMIASHFRPSFSTATPITLDPSLYPAPATTFLRTLDPLLGPLGEEVTRLSLGVEGGTGNWSSCPASVSDTNPGVEQCSISDSSVVSPCQCEGERCVVEVTEQPSLNDWILATRTHHIQTRHGGITLGVKDPREGVEGQSGALVWYDNSAFHALPAYVNLLNNARLRRLAGPSLSITAINHPIVFTLHGMWSMTIQQHVADLGIGLLVLVALTVVCAATVGCMVAERVRGERTLLHLAGLSKTTYWMGSALWDTGVVVLNILLIAAVFLVFKEQQFIWRENLWAFVVLAFLYGLSALPLFYLLEGWFRTEASAVFFFFCSFFGVGLITTLLLVVCQVMSYIQGMNDTAAVIKYVFLVFPPFAFTCSLKDMAASYTRASIMARFDMDLYQSPFLWDPELEGGLGVYMVALGAWAVVGWALLLCPRPSLAPAPLPPGGEAEEDKDVAAERIKIQCGGAALYDTVLRLVGLGRDFSSPPVTAVGNLFLAIRRGECFSLLGLNGAGKTTTFRCLTGELRPSRGQILVNGLPLEEALDLSRPVLSYCPQSHALDPNLTPREALINMARIKGASGTRTRKVVERAMKQLGLSGEADTFVRHLSGGNKRKLSVALALLGNPLLVLMDEPTTGMDPASRRLVWRAIQSVSQAGRSVLLTSHSMDEVNQLSHRLAIMVNGHFVCLGSPHYLKHRLGDKYTVRLKTRDIEDMSYVLDYLRSHLKEVLLKEQHHLSLTVEVSRQLPLQLIFDTMNGAKSLGVTEYDVSQTTLNEVFRVLTSYQSDGCSALRDRRPTLTQDTLPSLIPHLYQAKTKPTTKDPTYQRLSVLAPVECAASPTAPYDNYGYVMGSFGKDGSPVPKNGAAKDSTQEEWTHL